MFTYEQKCLIDLSDNYTVLFSFIVREMINAFGIEGERAAREGTRRYGRDRGEHSREKHLAMGAKINMKSLFSLGGDLPGDPRFRRELQELNPEERVSHTLVCPMADIWKAYGEREVGRIYCEEFHPACYSHYAFDLSHVNLAKTLTQETDDYCAFNVVLRAQDVPDELKSTCFAEYDPEYITPKFDRQPPDGKTGFDSLSIKLYYYLLECAMEAFAEKGAEAVEQGLVKMGMDGAKRVKATAAEYGVPTDDKLIFDTYPLWLEPEKDPLWSNYRKCDAMERYTRCFVPAFRKELSNNEV